MGTNSRRRSPPKLTYLWEIDYWIATKVLGWTEGKNFYLKDVELKGDKPVRSKQVIHNSGRVFTPCTSVTQLLQVLTQIQMKHGTEQFSYKLECRGGIMHDFELRIGHKVHRGTGSASTAIRTAIMQAYGWNDDKSF